MILLVRGSNFHVCFLSSGKFPCLFCHIQNDELKIPKSERGLKPKRTLETLKNDYEKFTTEFASDKSKAKLCHNVIDQTLFNVPLSQVNIPEKLIHNLIISMGLYEYKTFLI